MYDLSQDYKDILAFIRNPDTIITNYSSGVCFRSSSYFGNSLTWFNIIKEFNRQKINTLLTEFEISRLDVKIQRIHEEYEIEPIYGKYTNVFYDNPVLRIYPVFFG